MQVELSRRFSEGKAQRMTDPGRFARFALKTSRYSQASKNKLLKELEDAFAFARTGKVGKDDFKKWTRHMIQPTPALSELTEEERKLLKELKKQEEARK